VCDSSSNGHSNTRNNWCDSSSSGHNNTRSGWCVIQATLVTNWRRRAYGGKLNGPPCGPSEPPSLEVQEQLQRCRAQTLHCLVSLHLILCRPPPRASPITLSPQRQHYPRALSRYNFSNLLFVCVFKRGHAYRACTQATAHARLNIRIYRRLNYLLLNAGNVNEKTRIFGEPDCSGEDHTASCPHNKSVRIRRFATGGPFSYPIQDYSFACGSIWV
jgi:hypothetical protein